MGAALLSALLMCGCAKEIRPDDLAVPSQITCINVKEALSFNGHYGALKKQWTTRLERGQYWSEKMDDKGTYYRGPPGGLTFLDNDGKGIPGQPVTYDGGFYIPNNPDDPVTKYMYLSSVPVHIPPEDADCSSTGYVKDPYSSKVSYVAVPRNSAAIGVSAVTPIRAGDKSYPQPAVVVAGAVGGVIGGMIVMAVASAVMGKIDPGFAIQDPQFMAKLRELAASAVPVQEVQLPAVPDTTVAAPPAAEAQ